MIEGDGAARPTIHRFADPAALAEGAAAWIADALTGVIAARGQAGLALAGGNTPRALHRQLAARGPAIDWGAIRIWFGDERCVPPTDDASNYRMARDTLLDRLPVAPAAVERIDGERGPIDAAADYQRRLELAPPLDLVVLGMGDDGHVASWFPATPAFAPAALAAVTDSPLPPHARVTMTPRALASAGAIVLLVSGAAKAARLAEVWAEVAAGDPRLPAARVSAGAREIHWFLDEAAASVLPVPVSASEPVLEPVLAISDEETP